jgi:HK97 family phage major capsid protein
LKALKANGYKQDKQINVEIKAAVTMGLDTTIYTGATQQTITQNTGIISTIRQRAERYLAAVSVGQIGTDRALWVEETDEQGTPIFIGEGDTKTQISVKYVEKDAKVKKIAVRGRITQEMFDDLPQLVNYIYNNMMKRVQTKIEDQLLNGDNTGDNLNGVITVATAFAAGDSAETIVAPNEFDVMNAIATQVEIANGVPNAIFVHPRTIQAMKAIKATDGTPLWRLYVDMLGEMTVAGMRVISTTAVTAGDFVGGDMSVANVLFRESLNLRVGLDGTDWSENKKTALLESRLVQFVSANDVQVVVKGDFATAKTALQVVVTP